MSKIVILISIICCACVSHARIDQNAVLAEKSFSFQSPQGESELCFHSLHLEMPGVSYSKKDFKKENELCSYDFYKTGSFGICPKLHSTNPAIEVFDAEGFTSQGQFEIGICAKSPGAKSDGDKLAKYKMSYSCSYTHSILGYYHVSRIFGGILDVPQSVLRTVDVKENYRLALKAEAIAVPAGKKCISKDLIRNGNLIGSMWCNLREIFELVLAGQPGREGHRSRIMTTDEKFTYGALSVNPKTERFYSEFYSKSGSQGGRLKGFKKSSIFKAISSSSAIENHLRGAGFNAQNLQQLQQYKDASEMLLMDYLFEQADRFGNIHYRKRAFRLEGNELVDSKPGKGADEIVVKKMILKDNDCGYKSNFFHESRVIEQVNHLSKKTYDQLLRLAEMISEPELEDYFVSSLAFPKKHFRKFQKNLIYAASLFQDKCRRGQLRLDLNLPEIFSGENSGAVLSCEI